MMDVYLLQYRDQDLNGRDIFIGAFCTLDGALAEHAESLEDQCDYEYSRVDREYQIIHNHAWVVDEYDTWRFYNLIDDKYGFDEISVVPLGD